MQLGPDYVKIPVTEDGWITCPICRRNKRLKRIFPDESAEHVALYCKDCKRYVHLKIHKGQCFESRCQHHAN